MSQGGVMRDKKCNEWREFSRLLVEGGMVLTISVYWTDAKISFWDKLLCKGGFPWGEE